MEDGRSGAQVETPADFGTDPQGLRDRWVAEIERYDQWSKAWRERAREIVQRYRDERASATDWRNSIKKFNILWSNVQVLQPALYARTPRPVAERRWRDSDPVGRAAAEVLQRVIEYHLDDGRFDRVMRAVVQDRLLGGRGTAWVRYQPSFAPAAPARIPVAEVTDADGATSWARDDGRPVDPAAVKDPDGEAPYIEEPAAETLAAETVEVEYVDWTDFGHAVARQWDEVSAVWRRVYLTRDQIVQRFGDEVGSAVDLDHTPSDVAGRKADAGGPPADQFRKAGVYEVWDRDTRRVIWVAKGYKTGPLDVRDDPLRLHGFFPCPPPLYATMTTDTLIPVPDFAEYQDQARELDELTARIDHLQDALRLRGVYDSSEPAIAMLLSQPDKTLVPISQWQAWAQKGGLSSAIELLSITDIAAVLAQLYNVRNQTKQELYEITGLSDIIRGQSNASETATAQQIKGRFATLRLQDSQADVQRFARDTMRLIGEIVAEHFTAQSLRLMSGVTLLGEQERQAVQMAAEAGHPVPPEIERAMGQPPLEAVMEMLRSDAIRRFRIDIETDSTIAVDDEAEKRARVEFLQAAGGFLGQAVQVAQAAPQFTPLLSQMLLFGVRGFRVGRSLESSFEDAMDAAAAAPAQPQQQQQQAPQPPPPDPRAEAAMADVQRKAARDQAEIELKGRQVAAEAGIQVADSLMDRGVPPGIALQAAASLAQPAEPAAGSVP